MSALVGIIYGRDSQSNPLTVLVNPASVTTTLSSPTSFSVILSTVGATGDLAVTNPNREAFGTSLNFNGPTGCDSLMKTQWENAVNGSTPGQAVQILDFNSQGYSFSRQILIST